MSTSILRVVVLSPTLVEVSPPVAELGVLTQHFSEHGLLAMRQSDSVMVEGSWRTILTLVAGYDGDPWLSEAPIEEVAVPV